MLVIADARARRRPSPASWAAPRPRCRRRRATVVFESAYFKPASVRRTSKRLGLKTEASARFERGADVNAPVVALQRALALMEQIGAGRLVGPIVDRYPQPRGADARCICGARGWRALLGLRVPDADVERILRGARARRVTPAADGWDVDGADLPRRSRCARSISSRRSAGTTASTSSSRRFRR